MYNVSTMETQIIPIGNSKGIRIPKAILKECGFNGTVSLEVKGGKLIIGKPRRKPREGWAEAAKRCHANEDDKLLWPEDMHDDYIKDWTWPGQKG